MAWPSNQSSELSKSEIESVNEKFSELDDRLGFEVDENFRQFSQIDDMFTRAFWDETVQTEDTDGFFNSYRMEFAPRRGEGFSQKDFALRNASWAVSDIISNRSVSTGRREGFQSHILNDTPVAPTRTSVENPETESNEIKNIAKLFGADLVGITEVDPRWHYATRVDTNTMTPAPNTLPNDITHVIVMGHAMDHDLVGTYPSALAGVSTGLEYSHETSIVIQLSTYIRNLGYEAIASMNDTALVIPYAIKAGLGEYGRNQMVITPQFGPRIRFSKIFTNLPLTADQPKSMGITSYCETCNLCAAACPPKALPFGEPSNEPLNRSTINGVKKWSADCEKCFGYWAKLKTDCAICMRVCPFNNQQKWHERIWYKVATSKFRKLAKWWIGKKGLPVRTKPKTWWQTIRG